MVDLLKQEQAELQKAMIEEMAKDIETIETEEGHKMLNETFAYVKEYHKYNNKKDFAKAHDKTLYERTAERLYNLGYAKFDRAKFIKRKDWQEVREQAVKEFVNKAKKKAYPFPCAIGVEYAVSLRQLDEALKEFIGEKE